MEIGLFLQREGRQGLGAVGYGLLRTGCKAALTLSDLLDQSPSFPFRL